MSSRSVVDTKNTCPSRLRILDVARKPGLSSGDSPTATVMLAPANRMHWRWKVGDAVQSARIFSVVALGTPIRHGHSLCLDEPSVAASPGDGATAFGLDGIPPASAFVHIGRPVSMRKEASSPDSRSTVHLRDTAGYRCYPRRNRKLNQGIPS